MSKLFKIIKNSYFGVNGTLAPSLILAFFSFLIWGVTLSFGWVWDDRSTILGQPLLHEPRIFWEAWVNDFWALHEVSQRSGYFRPINTILYALLTQIFGMTPWAFHFLNVLLHALTGVFAYAFLKSLGGSPQVAFGAAILFLVHPLQSEPVSFVSALPDLTSAFFGIVSLTYLVWGKTYRSLLLLALSLLSKESAVVFYLLGLWIGVGPLGSKRKWFSVWNGVGAILVLVYIWTHQAITQTMGIRSIWGGTLETHLATVFSVFGFAFGQILWPTGISPTRWLPLQNSFFGPLVWVGLSILLVLLTLVIRLWRTQPRISFFTGFFLILYLPVSNLLPAEGLFADRYLYLPIFFLMGTLLLFLEEKGISFKRIKLRDVYVVVMVLIFCGLSYRESLKWRTEESLWVSATNRSPNSSVAWNELGRVYLEKKAFDRADHAFRRALQVNPRHHEVLLNQALSHFQSGRLAEATKYLENYLQAFANDARGWDLLSALEEQKRNLPLSILAEKRAVELDPKNWKYAYNLGTLYLRKREYGNSIRYLQKAIGLAPHREEVWLNLAAAHFQSGNLDEAIQMYREILVRWPEHPKAKMNLQELERIRS